MAESLFVRVDEVCQMLAISRAEAYRIIKRKNCVILRNERSAKKKSTVVNDRAQFSVGTMRSPR